MDSLQSNPEATELEEGMVSMESAGRGDCSFGSVHNTSISFNEGNAKEKFLSSHKELQEAKKKLEELRLLRFEEKSSLKQEIEQLNEKFGEEERNSSNLERQLKKYSADKMALDKKVSDLEREQSIGTQINMMQEQEIVRLEMKLKDEELQRYDVSRQLDVLRKTILEKDQLRLQQQNEMYAVKEGIAQLDESNNYYKTAVDEAQQKILETEDMNGMLSDELMSHKTLLEEARSEIAKLCVDVKNAQTKITETEDKTANAEREFHECQEKLKSQVERCETVEDERRKQEAVLQAEIDNTTFNENKYKDKCEQTERLFHETRREKDEQIFDLQRIVDRVPTLEEQIENLKTQNAETEFVLNDLREAIARHIRKRNVDEKDVDDVELTPKLSSPMESPSKVSPSKSPMKGEVVGDVTIEEIEEYFKEAYASVLSSQEQIASLSQQVEEEQAMMAELSTTIGELRSELERSQSDLVSMVKVRETIQGQYQQANETIQLQERNNERKTKENEHLRELVQDCEGQINRLKAELVSASAQMQQCKEEQETEIHGKNKEIEGLNEKIEEYTSRIEVLKAELASLNAKLVEDTETHNEEETRLQIVVKGLESNIENVQGEKRNEQEKFEEEANSLKETIECRDKEVKDVNSEMEILIEDNKNLVQRLAHLESYSDKLSDMLDKNQTADDKAREKFSNEIKEYKQIIVDKDVDMNELTRKVEEVTSSGREKSEQMEKKLNELSSSHQKNLVETSEKARKDKDELEGKLKSASEAHLSAEKILAENTEENLTLEKRCTEQLKLMEELHERVNLLETENGTLKQNVSTMERGVKLKESLIAELSRKAGETTESFSTLKNTIQKSESDKRHYENKLNMFRHEKQGFEKTIREHEDEKTYLRDQVANLQRLLAKAEDDKEVSLGNMAHYQSQVETLRSIKEKTTLKDLEGQIQSLRVELNLERQRRERLETRYTKRDDQVSQLRSTFDHSLNTISKDTKNIKNIIGKSLQKIDRIENNEVTDSDLLDTDSESFAVNNPKTANKYLSLPSHRSKSLEATLEGLKANSYTPSAPRRSSKHSEITKSTPSSAPKSIATVPSPSKVLSFTPVRDEVPSYRKNKRLTSR